MSDQNPYASPSVAASENADYLPDIELKDLKMIEVIVKDAGQFWLAIILCILCSSIGSLIIPIWYGFRLNQWYKYKNKYPALMMTGFPKQSLPARFQTSPWKLIVGIVFGVGMLGLTLMYLLLLIVAP